MTGSLLRSTDHLASWGLWLAVVAHMWLLPGTMAAAGSPPPVGGTICDDVGGVVYYAASPAQIRSDVLLRRDTAAGRSLCVAAESNGTNAIRMAAGLASGTTAAGVSTWRVGPPLADGVLVRPCDSSRATTNNPPRSVMCPFASPSLSDAYADSWWCAPPSSVSNGGAQRGDLSGDALLYAWRSAFFAFLALSYQFRVTVALVESGIQLTSSTNGTTPASSSSPPLRLYLRELRTDAALDALASLDNVVEMVKSADVPLLSPPASIAAPCVAEATVAPPKRFMVEQSYLVTVVANRVTSITPDGEIHGDADDKEGMLVADGKPTTTNVSAMFDLAAMPLANATMERWLLRLRRAIDDRRLDAFDPERRRPTPSACDAAESVAPGIESLSGIVLNATRLSISEPLSNGTWTGGAWSFVGPLLCDDTLSVVPSTANQRTLSHEDRMDSLPWLLLSRQASRGIISTSSTRSLEGALVRLSSFRVTTVHPRRSAWMTSVELAMSKWRRYVAQLVTIGATIEPSLYYHFTLVEDCPTCPGKAVGPPLVISVSLEDTSATAEPLDPESKVLGGRVVAIVAEATGADLYRGYAATQAAKRLGKAPPDASTFSPDERYAMGAARTIDSCFQLAFRAVTEGRLRGLQLQFNDTLGYPEHIRFMMRGVNDADSDDEFSGALSEMASIRIKNVGPGITFPTFSISEKWSNAPEGVRGLIIGLSFVFAAGLAIVVAACVRHKRQWFRCCFARPHLLSRRVPSVESYGDGQDDTDGDDTDDGDAQAAPRGGGNQKQNPGDQELTVIGPSPPPPRLAPPISSAAAPSSAPTSEKNKKGYREEP